MKSEPLLSPALSQTAHPSETIDFVAECDPFDVPTSETIAFLTRCLRPPPLRILEVGCGRGHVARQLLRLGYNVVPIDSSAKSIHIASTLGLSAIHKDFLQLDDSPYDVILFSRSLHHFDALSYALDKANMLLAANGRLILEEFAVDQITEAAAQWLYEMEDMLRVAKLIESNDRAQTSGAALRRWQNQHAANIHSKEVMLSAIRRRFDILSVETAPYLYRYFCARISPSATGASALRCILRLEQLCLNTGAFISPGLRVVATSKKENATR